MNVHLNSHNSILTQKHYCMFFNFVSLQMQSSETLLKVQNFLQYLFTGNGGF